MTDKIIELLKASGATAYEVSDTVTEAWEFYFIGHRLDQNRIRDVEHINVTVYKALEDGKFLGSASDEIAPTATEAEAKKIIDDLLLRASYVKNAYFELNKENTQVENKDYDVEKMAKDYIEALQQIPETSTEDINSYEIFAEKCTKRYVNSEGIDVTFVYPSSQVEVVVNARNDDHEIELYRMYKAGSCDKDHLVKELTDTLRFGKDRLKATPTPALKKATVLFSTEDAASLFQYFGAKMMASMKYRGLSNWEIGKEIADDVTGDKITLRALKELPNSSANRPVDSQGAPVHDMYILKDNVPENYWGDVQFRYYLGIKDSFIAGNFSVDGGSSTEAELRSGTYLEPVEFSDFSVDPITGDIAGEIRLAYYHDGDKVTPVTGGSVSGSLPELLKNMKLSKEQKQYDCNLIPSVIKVENVTIAGAE
ncbi:metallopeptidase TldD-related protein [Butyrivibrio sp. AE3009]|uniref:metallopeptidase TldD-related protein n=1 Tax=Butyrivibrio sp. AE3009 TaxID=1280666 RepID=UPI0003B4AA4C|nr:metallopeptidase TldD-related protein [Butyrivibrio sp. AE3009]